MIHRNLTDALISAANRYPVVSLTGPASLERRHWCEPCFPIMRTFPLRDADHRAFALEDPRGFLGQFSGNVILDEVQHTPDLFSYIQGIVDEENRPGQSILTGSQNFLLLQRISRLAGRCSVLHLLPLARTELTAGSPMNISDIGQKFTPLKPGKDDWCDVLFKGFYPRHSRSETELPGLVAELLRDLFGAQT